MAGKTDFIKQRFPGVPVPVTSGDVVRLYFKSPMTFSGDRAIPDNAEGKIVKLTGILISGGGRSPYFLYLFASDASPGFSRMIKIQPEDVARTSLVGEGNSKVKALVRAQLRILVDQHAAAQ